MQDDRDKRWSAAGELIVPLVMGLFLVAYWWQAAGVSANARAFPVALTVALPLLFGLQLVALWRERRGRREPGPGEGPARDPAGATTVATRETVVVTLQRAAVIGGACVLLFFWRELGGTVVIFAFALGALLVLGERRLPILALLPTFLAVALTYLFQVLLRVRFPTGLVVLF